MNRLDLVSRLPPFPDARYRHHRLVPQVDCEWVFVASIALPFVEARERYYTVPMVEWLRVAALLGVLLATRIDEQVIGRRVHARRPRRYESPPKRFKCSPVVPHQNHRGVSLGAML